MQIWLIAEKLVVVFHRRHSDDQSFEVSPPSMSYSRGNEYDGAGGEVDHFSVEFHFSLALKDVVVFRALLVVMLLSVLDVGDVQIAHVCIIAGDNTCA